MSRAPNPARGIGRDIRDARRAFGWSQTELAQLAQVSRPTISRVETGANISTDTLTLRWLRLSLFAASGYGE